MGEWVEEFLWETRGFLPCKIFFGSKLISSPQPEGGGEGSWPEYLLMIPSQAYFQGITFANTYYLENLLKIDKN